MIVHPTNPLDRALFSALPLVLAPRRDPLSPVEIGATRLVLASDGLYIEARTRVLHACGRIADADRLPYGPMEPFVTSLLGCDPSPLLDRAVQSATRSLPNEWAGVIVRQRDDLALYEPPILASSPGRVRYDATSIDPLDVLWDLHSHARMPAFFSGQDDADDLSCPSPCFLASVIGKCQQATPVWATRLVIGGRAFDHDNPVTSRHLASPSRRERMEA